MRWYIKAMKNILNFQGRAQRKEFWYFMLFATILTVVFFYLLLAPVFNAIDFDAFGGDEPPTDEEIEAMLGGGAGFAIKSIFLNIFLLSHLVAVLSVTVRRLHDTDRSAWWVFLYFIPIGQLVLLVFMLMQSNFSSNRYGACPLDGYAEDDDEYDDYPEDEYDDDEPAPANQGQAGRRPAHASPLGTQAQSKAERIAPVSDEGLDYSDRFNTHGAEIDNTQIDRRFGLLDSPSPDENMQGAGSGLDYVEFTTDDEPSFSHSLDHAEKDRRLGILAAEGGLSLEAPPPERIQPTPASKTNLDRNWEQSAPRNISSIEAETPGGLNERFGLMEQTPQTRSPAPAAKTPRYISALPPKGQAPQTATPAGVQRPIARPSSPPAAPQHPGMRPTQQMGTRPTQQTGVRPAGAPQPMNRPATGAASGLPSINPAVNRPRMEDPAFSDFEPTRQLRPAGAPPAATRPPMQQQPPRAQVPQAPHASQVQRAPAGMPNAPQPLHRPQGQTGQTGRPTGQPVARPTQPGQQPVARPSAQYSNPLAHSGNEALGRAKAGLKPAAPQRAAPSRAAEQNPSDESGNMWSKFLPKK